MSEKKVLKTSFDDIYNTDETKAVEGVDVPIGINSKGDVISLIVAEMGNPNHEKKLARYEKLLRATKNNEKERLKVLVKILSGPVLVGWKNLLDDKGKVVEFTEALGAQKMLEHKRMRDTVMEAALDEQAYQAILEEEDNESLGK